MTPKNSTVRKFWESLSDEELENTDLIIDDPESLPGLVKEIPEGDEDTYVEFKYDLRGSGRAEEFECVHGHHRHLAGFVMRKGERRFMVGWICGGTIYGEDFDAYTADFDAAVARKDTLRRAKDIRTAIDPFLAWIKEVNTSGVFGKFQNTRDQAYEHFQWVYDNLFFVSQADMRAKRMSYFPDGLFSEDNDPELEWDRAALEFHAISMQALAREEWAEQNIAHMKRTMEMLLKRFERVIDMLKELENFFQPEVLALVCEYANENDNPKKRTYLPGLGFLTMKRDKGKLVLCLPRNYRVPDRKAIDAFRTALSGLRFLKSKAA
jgi:hypothetical protein